MNTDKTLEEKFCEKKDKYPIWYYKKLESVDIDYVIFNLLKETFVVELNNKKIVITFGKNKKGEIGSTQSCEEGLDFTSYECINKSFTKGKWFKILDEETTDDFKQKYRKEKEERDALAFRKFNIEILTKLINSNPDLSDATKQSKIEELSSISDEELKAFVKYILDNAKE